MGISMMVMGYLTLLTYWDARRRMLPVGILKAGTCLAVGTAVYCLIEGYGQWQELLFGAVPGFILLFISWLTGAAGAGDGLVLLQLNLFFFLEKVVVAFGASLLGIGLFALGYLILGRKQRDFRLPYMPFLWIGCLVAVLLCG